MYNKIVNKTIKYLVISILLISLFIISLFVFPPSYADTIEMPQIPNYVASTYLDVVNNGIYIGHGNSYYYVSANTDDAYIFFVKKENSNTNYRVYFVSENQFTYYYSTGSLTTSTASFDSTNNIYYQAYSSLTTYLYLTEINSNIPIYDTYEEGIANIPSNTPSISLYEGLNIPVGYIARIRVTNGSKFTMLTTMGTDNISFQDKWVYTSQWYKFNDSPDPEIIMASDGITIPWIRYGNLNLLGQTNKAQYTITSTLGTYVWVFNPAYMVGQNADLYDTKLNSNIKLVDVQNIDQVRIYALKSSYGFNGVVSATSTGSGITYDTNTNSWLDNEGNQVTPSEYGDTNVPATGTTIIQQLDSLLNNLINRIERLLVAPIDYINMLISEANNFFLWLRGVWSWLPDPVIESISAVLIITCTVGALKLLWR